MNLCCLVVDFWVAGQGNHGLSSELDGLSFLETGFVLGPGILIVYEFYFKVFIFYNLT